MNVPSFGLSAEDVNFGSWKALPVKEYGATSQGVLEQWISEEGWAGIKVIHKHLIALSKKSEIQTLHYGFIIDTFTCFFGGLSFHMYIYKLNPQGQTNYNSIWCVCPSYSPLSPILAFEATIHSSTASCLCG